MILTSKHTDFCTLYRSLYRYGYQGSESDSEVKGEGNSYTTFYRMLDPRIGRWFSTDPVTQPWQSPYTSMDNNPIWYNDVLGDEVINGHKEDNKKAKNRLDKAESKKNSLTRGDDGFRDAKKEFRHAKKDYKWINNKYNRVQNKIDEVASKDKDLFNKANTLTDEGGKNEVNIYVYDVPNYILQQLKYSNNGENVYGDTDAKSGTRVSNVTTGERYIGVRSEKKGDNTVVVRLSDISKTIHLAHEFGHAIFQTKNMTKYLEWLSKNPTEKNKGGHGENDPSGEAAEAAEKKFK